MMLADTYNYDFEKILSPFLKSSCYYVTVENYQILLSSDKNVINNKN